MNSFLVLIPVSLLQDRVISFLELAELVRLDSALLSHVVRPLFLEQLRGVRLMTESLSIDNAVARWIFNRRIVISDLLVSEKATDLTFVKRLASSVDTLVSIDNCKKITSKAVMDFIQACKTVKFLNLKSLRKGNAVLASIGQSFNRSIFLTVWILTLIPFMRSRLAAKEFWI